LLAFFEFDVVVVMQVMFWESVGFGFAEDIQEFVIFGGNL
jgi:hypothetical protein